MSNTNNAKENKKNKTLIVILLLLLVGLTTAYITSSYAKYVSKLDDRNGTATVAKWAFDTNNKDAKLEFSLDNTYDESTLVAGKIAPGTTGKFTINLSNKDTETGVNYVVKIGDTTGKPTNLKFYDENNAEISDNGITGTLAPNAGNELITIKWKWAYDTESGAGDESDTADGKAAANLTVPVSITGTQVEPKVKAGA